MSLRKRVVTVFMLIFAGVCAASPAAAGDAANLTESNRLVLAEKVLELQRMELMKVSRGRLKSNPIAFPMHTVYQMALQDQELLIRRQADGFANALAGLERVLSEFTPELGTDEGKAAAAYFRSELIRLYDLREPLAAADSLFKVAMTFDNSVIGMEALPLRAGMALNARRWAMKKAKGGRLPADIEAQLDLLMRKWGLVYDVFQLEEAVGALSKEYAKFFLRIAEEGKTAE